MRNAGNYPQFFNMIQKIRSKSLTMLNRVVRIPQVYFHLIPKTTDFEYTSVTWLILILYFPRLVWTQLNA